MSWGRCTGLKDLGNVTFPPLTSCFRSSQGLSLEGRRCWWHIDPTRLCYLVFLTPAAMGNVLHEINLKMNNAFVEMFMVCIRENVPFPYRDNSRTFVIFLRTFPYKGKYEQFHGPVKPFFIWADTLNLWCVGRSKTMWHSSLASVRYVGPRRVTCRAVCGAMCRATTGHMSGHEGSRVGPFTGPHVEPCRATTGHMSGHVSGRMSGHLSGHVSGHVKLRLLSLFIIQVMVANVILCVRIHVAFIILLYCILYRYSSIVLGSLHDYSLFKQTI